MENKYEYVISHGKHGVTPEDCKTLTWTTETPTVEGWYWFRVKSGTSESSITELSYIEIRGGRACFAPLVNGYEFDDDYEMSDITHWLGPIPAPEPPTE
jgi:hypothetical protein